MKFKLPLGEKYYDLFILRETAFLVYPLNVWRRSLVKGFLNFSDELNLKPEKILEVGCGNGFFTRLLSYRFPTSKIFSIDTSQKSIDYARKRNLSNVQFKKHDFFEVSGKYDLIVSLHVFILLDTNEAFEKVNALLSENGIAFLTYTRKTSMTELHKKFYEIVVGDKIEFKDSNYLLKKAKEYHFSANILQLDYKEGSFAIILRRKNNCQNCQKMQDASC